MQLLGDSSTAGPERTRVFRASRYWAKNVRGLPIVLVSVAAFFLVLGGILIGTTGTVSWVSVVLIVGGICVPLATFPGKVAALYPYAAEIQEGKGIRFYSALGDTYFATDQLKAVRWSWVFGGWVVTLKRRYGLLSGFLLHFGWGSQGRELAQAITEELGRGEWAGGPR